MKTSKTLLFLFTFALSLFFASCSSSIEIKAGNQKTADVNFSINLGKEFYDILQNLTSGMAELNESSGLDSENIIFSESEIRSNFEGSDFKNLSVKVPNAREIFISGEIPSPDNQVAVNDGSNIKIANFLTCTDSSLTIILSAQSIQEFVKNLPVETQSYFDLFMAPVFGSEVMSEQDYKNLISLVYGNEISSVLEKASIKVTLLPPEGKSIKKASLSDTEQSKTSLKKAVFSVPLFDFLTLQDTKTFSISW